MLYPGMLSQGNPNLERPGANLPVLFRLCRRIAERVEMKGSDAMLGMQA